MNDRYAEAKRELKKLIQKMEYLKYTSNSLLYWDKITHMPPGGIAYRSQVMGFLGEELYRLLSGKTLTRLMEALQDDDRNDEMTTATLHKLSRNAIYVSQIPKSEYTEYIELVANTEQVWEKARKENNFLLVRPYLEGLMERYRRFPKYWGYENNPYDAWLGYYEEGFDSAVMDRLIGAVKPVLLQLLTKIREKEAGNREAGMEEEGACLFCQLPPVEERVQLELTKKLLSRAGFSFHNGRVDIGAHPTILSSSPMDVRLVTSFHERDLSACIFNAMYLAGKGLYEQKIDSRLLGTLLAEVPSFALEEGIGRLYENKIGRSRTFWEDFMPTLQEAVPALKGYRGEQLFREVNRINLTPVRLDADELTYMLHIIIRCELERELMDQTITVSELPQAWNAKYREYFSVEPKNDGEGVLQDIHWFSGYFGYFASYLLAGLSSAQFAHCIQRDLPNFETASAEKRFSMADDWLSQRVFRFGGIYSSPELIKRACGEPLNAEYYVSYLNKRFSEAYNLEQST